MLAIPFDTAKDRLRRARRSLEATCGSQLDTAVAEERPATTRAAKAAVASVLAGVLAGIGRPAAAAAGALATKTVAVMLAGALAAGVAIGVVGQRLVSEHVAPAPAVASVDPIVAAPPARVAQPAIAAPAAPTASVSTSAARPAKAASADDIAAEAKLVDDARLALRGGRTRDAIALLQAHAKRFASGQLAEERDLLWIEAAIAIDDHADASERVARFRASYPATVHADRLDALAAQL